MYIFFPVHNGVLLVLICWSSSSFILARKELFAWERFGLHVQGTERGKVDGRHMILLTRLHDTPLQFFLYAYKL